MTTKKALEIAISALKNQDKTERTESAIRRLQKLQTTEKVAKWTKTSICQALDQWRDQHGKAPTVTNLGEPGMPGGNIILKHFGVQASTFLHQRYPSERKREQRNLYGFTTPADWLACFREQFRKHCREDGFNSNTYNRLKDEGTPPWMTIARRCGVAQWRLLMEKAGVQYPQWPTLSEPDRPVVVTVVSPWLDRYEAALVKREQLDRELLESLERHDRQRRACAREQGEDAML